MRFGKEILATTAAVALAFSPAVAQAAQAKAKPVSSKVKRAAQANKGENKLGGASGTLIGVIAAAAVILGIVLVSDGSDSPWMWLYSQSMKGGFSAAFFVGVSQLDGLK
jgi:hypothetical protein